MSEAAVGNYTKEELLKKGFSKVGSNPTVSRDARLFAVRGELGDNVRIDAFAVLTGEIYLGSSTHVSPFCFLGGTGGRITMADNSGISTHVSIFTKSDDYGDIKSGREERKKITGAVSIGKNSIVGSGSIVLPGVTIGENVTLGCHVVVNQNVQDGLTLISRGIGLLPVAGKSAKP